ncbi:MAG: nucleotide pyrophosphohydrolase [Promethearchaeota archaeon]
MNGNSKNNDLITPISFFKEKVRKFIEERNWERYHTPKNLVQAINCEVGELSSLLLFKEYSKDDVLSNKKLFENLSDEVADVFIYLISFINTIGLDLTQAFIKKLEKNNSKYPVKEFNNGNYYKK